MYRVRYPVIGAAVLLVSIGVWTAIHARGAGGALGPQSDAGCAGCTATKAAIPEDP